MSSTDVVSVEATGETVGEAKWAALRELEQRVPGLDRESVQFQVVSEGERGLLGVGFTPAHVIATVKAALWLLEAHQPPMSTLFPYATSSPSLTGRKSGTGCWRSM